MDGSIDRQINTLADRVNMKEIVSLWPDKKDIINSNNFEINNKQRKQNISLNRMNKNNTKQTRI